MSRIKKAIKKVSKAEGFQKLGVEEVENKLNTFDYSQLPKPGKNKGDRGQLFETALGIPNGSDLIDLIDGELKSFTEGETIKVTALKHCLDEIVSSVEFYDSKVYQKLKQTIYVGFDRDGKFLKSKTINEQNDFDHYQQLADDFGYIAANVKKAIVNKETLHTITGPNGLLQIRTNASKNKKTGKYTPLCYNGVELRDKYMAFYLLADFGKSITK
jgi:hypothetical protein|tara:strand:- start:743 stop:1387 length:645 start_codon:yes stop_codon:yes gene_type:complete